MIRGLVALSLFWAAIMSSAKGVPQVILNPAETVIVMPAEPSRGDRIAASALCQQLTRIYGDDGGLAEAGFRIVENADYQPKNHEFVLAVGKTRWATDERIPKLRMDGYVLTRQDRVVVMAGPGEMGSLYAAVDFLDHCAGVRFYMPFDLFTSTPEQPEVTVGDLDVVSEPFATSVSFSGINFDDRAGYAWLMRNGGWRPKGGTHQHNMFTVFPPQRYAQRYPDIYPLLDGKRYIPRGPGDQTWQANFLSVHAVDAAMESAGLYFRQRPDAQYIAVSINDGGRFDQGAAMQAIIKQFADPNDHCAYDRAISHVYWSFMHKLGVRMEQEHPGKLLVGLAYGPTRFPPTEQLPENVVPFANFHIGELPSDRFTDPNETTNPTVYQWLRVAKHFGNHDWYHGSGYVMPRHYTGHWRTYLQALKAEINDTYVHVECYPNWGFAGPKYYLLAKLLWDPDADTDGHLEQFCGDMFGPAAVPMTAYFRELERLWIQMDTTDGPERKLMRWASQFQTTPASRAMVDACRQYLAQAAAQAATDEQLRRVTFFADHFRLFDGLVQMAASGPLADAAYQDLVRLAEELPKRYPGATMHPKRNVAAVRELQWHMRTSIATPVNAPKIPAPTIDGDLGDAAWKGALQGPIFMENGGVRDHQQTTARIAHDGKMLYIAVVCPRVDTRDYLETDDLNWRSDNVELKFDADGERTTPEGHMWVKTNGIVVNYTQRDSDKPSPIQAAIKKYDDRYDAEFAIPFTFFKVDPTAGKPFDLMIIRNEFTAAANGHNPNTYGALWNVRVRLAR